MILRTLQQTGGNRSSAAALLKINHRQLFARINQLRIEPGERHR